MLTAAIAPEQASTSDREVAEIPASIWFTALAGWASGRTQTHISDKSCSDRPACCSGGAEVSEIKVSAP